MAIVISLQRPAAILAAMLREELASGRGRLTRSEKFKARAVSVLLNSLPWVPDSIPEPA